MRVFIAGKYEQQANAKYLARELEKDGHVVVSRWMDRPYANTPDTDIEAQKRFTYDDLSDIMSCDVFVMLPHPYNFRVFEEQRMVMLGMAIAHHKNIICIGKRWTNALCVGGHVDDYGLMWTNIAEEVRRVLKRERV